MSRRRIEIGPDDPRLALFREMLVAADALDPDALKVAYHKLRRLGWSCCLMSERSGSSADPPSDRPAPGPPSGRRP